MPTYEYECIHCNYRFELFQNITDKPIATCPRCSKTVKRLISSGAGIIFKGSGFYATDYRKKPKKEEPATKTPNTCLKNKEECNTCPINPAPSKNLESFKKPEYGEGAG